MNKLSWHIEQRKVADLKTWEKNPRKLSNKQRKDLTESIERFDYVEVVIINLDNTLIGGHQRLKVLTDLNRLDDVIDVRVPNRMLTDHELSELAIRLNKNRGEWDDDLLSSLFTSDDLQDWGFDGQELNDLFDDIDTTGKLDDDFDIQEALDEIEEPITQPGDIWQLGNHRLICGDATSADDIKDLFGDEKANVIYCDPPYNIGFDFNKGTKGNKSYKETGERFFEKMSDEDYTNWLVDVIESVKVHSEPNAHVFMWSDPKFIGLIQEAYKRSGVSNKNVCFWVKNSFNPVKAIAFNRCIEPCVYGVIGKPHLNNSLLNLSELLNHDINTPGIQEDIFSYVNMWFNKRDSVNDYLHPTQKPVSLHDKPLKRTSSPNDIVFDGFGGSGSTLMWCEKSNRSARVIEKDQHYCDVIIKRWEKYAKKKAVKIR